RCARTSSGLREGEMGEGVAEQWDADLEAVRHAGAVGVHQAVLAEVRPGVGAHQRRAVHAAAEAVGEVAPERESGLGSACGKQFALEITRKTLARDRPGAELGAAIKQEVLPGEAATKKRSRCQAGSEEPAKDPFGKAVGIALLGVEEALVAAEQLVAAVAGERYLYVPPREAREHVRRHIRRVGERLVERGQGARELVGVDARCVELVMVG